ncbi:MULTISPECIES: PEP-CTERM sorting domain-containing protein [unclassified Bradyrhizobium]
MVTLSDGEDVQLFVDGTVLAVPEPATRTMMMLGFGVVGFLAYRQSDSPHGCLMISTKRRRSMDRAAYLIGGLMRQRPIRSRWLSPKAKQPSPPRAT